MNMKRGYTKAMGNMAKDGDRMTAGSMTKKPGQKPTMTKTTMKKNSGKKY